MSLDDPQAELDAMNGEGAPAAQVEPEPATEAPPAPPEVSPAALSDAAKAKTRRLRSRVQQALKVVKDDKLLEEHLALLKGRKEPKTEIPPAQSANVDKGPEVGTPPAPAPTPAPSVSKQEAAAQIVGMVIQALGQTFESVPALKPLSLNGTVPALELSERGIGFVEKDKATALAEAWIPLVAHYWDVDLPPWLALGMPAVITSGLVFAPGIRQIVANAEAAKAEAAKAGAR